MWFYRAIFFLSVVCALTGCKAMPWNTRSTPDTDSQVVDNFSDTRPTPTDEEIDLDSSTDATAKANDRFRLSGSGLSDRSRDIEKRLGYE